MDFYAVSRVGLLEIILLYTFLYMSLGNWYIFVGVELQDNTVCIHSIGRYLQTGFQYVPINTCTKNESSSTLSTVFFGFRHSVRYVAALYCGYNWHFTHKMNIVLYCTFGYIYIYVCILEKAMAPHSSTLAWKIPWTEEPGRLQTMGSQRVGHDWATSLSLFPFMHWRKKWQPTPVFLPGESQGCRSLVGRRLWGRTESDTTEAT